MVKKLAIFVMIVTTAIVAAIFIYRLQILQYSAENLIRKALPDYVTIEKINFEFKNNRVVLKDFRISNPPGFSGRYLIQIKEIACAYRMRTLNILDGIEILKPSFIGPSLSIERLRDGRLNLSEMQKYAEKSAAESKPREEAKAPAGLPAGKPVKKLSDFVKLPEEFEIKSGEVMFRDNLTYRSNPHMITFEKVEAKLYVKLDKSYSKVLGVSSSGRGDFNGYPRQVIRWAVSLNPMTPKLTMSNNFDVSNVDILPLEPYYDKYSPFIFKSGAFSGNLIFDFDNGNIGSTNEVRLSNLAFSVKEDYKNAQFWGTTVNDLAKYFTSSFGEIVFDFKIKGDMAKPNFYLGPISKQALASMAIDTISDIIDKTTQGSGQSAEGVDKAKKYIDIFKELIEKNK